MWVVVVAPGAHFGRVGRVERAAYEASLERDTRWAWKVRVQFGTDGPSRGYTWSSVIPLAGLVRQVEDATGCAYRSGEEDA